MRRDRTNCAGAVVFILNGAVLVKQSGNRMVHDPPPRIRHPEFSETQIELV